MKAAIVLASVAGLLSSQTWADVVHVQIRNGDVYLQQPQGWDRLTQGGRASDVTTSRDGSLIAYVRSEGMRDSEELNSVWLCVVAARACRVIVVPKGADSPEENLTGASAPQFSYQASAHSDGTLIGSIFFMTSAWATSAAIHRATLGPNPAVTFVTSSNSLSIVQNGKFAGALEISQHIYAPQGGSCDQRRILDPNTKRVLQTIPTPDCQELHIQ